MPQKLLTKLKSEMHYLSQVEQRIAKIIVDNPDEFITYSMSRLASKAGVSQGSIINFSNKFANCGFSELKLKIAAVSGKTVKKQFSVADKQDTVKQTMLKNFDSHNEAFSLTYELNSDETLFSVASRIMAAKRIEIYGIYRSAVVANDLYYQLIELGIHANFVSDILTCAVSATMLSEKDLVIAVSSSGKTKDIIDAVNNAKANNVPIICITSNAASPLAGLSDDVLLSLSSGRSVSDSSNEIRLSALLLIDTLCSYIRNNHGKINEKKYKELKNILNSHNVEETLND